MSFKQYLIENTVSHYQPVTGDNVIIMINSLAEVKARVAEHEYRLVLEVNDYSMALLEGCVRCKAKESKPNKTSKKYMNSWDANQFKVYPQESILLKAKDGELYEASFSAIKKVDDTWVLATTSTESITQKLIEGKMRKYSLVITDFEYKDLMDNQLGMWLHKWNPTTKQLTFDTGNPGLLAKYLSSNIDFGATDVYSVLGIDPSLQFKR